MIKTLFAFTVIISCCAVASAQGNTEFFGGYSVTRTDYNADTPLPPVPVIVAFDGEQTLHGVNASVTRYFKAGFGVTGDFSWHTKTLSEPDPLGGTIDTKIQVYNLLAGPQYKFARSKRVSPFVHALAGVAHTSAKITVESLNTSDTNSSTDFALALGGGVDIRVNDRIAIRAIQADFNPIFMGDGNQLGFNRRADNLRLSFGIVFR